MIYAARRLIDGRIKIGTSLDPYIRLNTLGRKGTLQIIAIWNGGRAEEKTVHIELDAWNVNRRCKAPDPCAPWRGEREWFHPSRQVMSYIRKAANLASIPRKPSAPRLPMPSPNN